MEAGNGAFHGSFGNYMMILYPFLIPQILIRPTSLRAYVYYKHDYQQVVSLCLSLLKVRFFPYSFRLIVEVEKMQSRSRMLQF